MKDILPLLLEKFGFSTHNENKEPLIETTSTKSLENWIAASALLITLPCVLTNKLMVTKLPTVTLLSEALKDRVAASAFRLKDKPKATKKTIIKFTLNL